MQSSAQTGTVEPGAAPTSSWPMKLYKIQVWIYLVLGICGLVGGLLAFIIPTLSYPGGLGLAGIAVVMVAAALFIPGLALTVLNVLTLQSKSSFGWWTHFLSVGLLGIALFAYLIPYRTHEGFGLGAVTPIIIGIIFVNLLIALVAKRAHLGGLGVLAPLLAIAIMLFGTVYPTEILEQKATRDIVAELEPTGDVAGSVVLGEQVVAYDGELTYDLAFYSTFRFSHRKVSLPDLPDADFYEVWANPNRQAKLAELAQLRDSSYYHVWFTNETRSHYYSADSFLVREGEINPVGGEGFISTYNTIPEGLKIADFPIVVVSIETLSASEALVGEERKNRETQAIINTPRGQKIPERTYNFGRAQATPTKIIFEGKFQEVNDASRSLFESAAPPEPIRVKSQGSYE